MQIKFSKEQIPWVMLAGRAVLGPLLIAGEACGWSGVMTAWLVVTALVSDIFDGVLARRWHCDTAGVRLFDSMADTVFYVCAAIALWIGVPQVWRENAGLLSVLVGLEVARFGLDFAKFGKPASYHSYLAKVWGLVMAGAVVAVFASGRTSVLIPVALGLGIACDLEGLVMSLMLPVWRKDVETLRVAWQLRAQMGGTSRAVSFRTWGRAVKSLGFAMVMWGLTGVGRAATETHRYRKTLAQSIEIQDYFCAKGYAWFYANGQLESCAVARETEFGVARGPAGSWITLDAAGKPRILQLVRDTQISEYKCRGGNWLLGPSEGATTAFSPSGKLKECWLAEDQDVQGIPCVRSGVFSGYNSLQLFESGKLRSCKLSRDYGKLRRGGQFVQA